MRKEVVSCLLCSYNAESFIDATIFSILHQTYESLEILVWDDGSTDRTLQKLQQWKEKDKRIQIFFDHGVKRGPYGGLNFLLKKAEGEFVAIQDHDDLWHREKIAKQVAFLDTHVELVGCGTATLMWYEGDQKGFVYCLKEGSRTLHPSLMFRNDGKARYPHQVYMNDAYFQKKVLCKGENLIVNLSETLTFHRVRSGSQNYSYRWFGFRKKDVQMIFYLHPVRYACCVLVFECFRKMLYPLLVRVGCGRWIDKIERFPFVLMSEKVERFGKERLEKMGFYNVW